MLLSYQLDSWPCFIQQIRQMMEDSLGEATLDRFACIQEQPWALEES